MEKEQLNQSESVGDNGANGASILSEMPDFNEHMKEARPYADDEFSSEEVRREYYEGGGREMIKELEEYGYAVPNLYSHEYTKMFNAADTFVDKNIYHAKKTSALYGSIKREDGSIYGPTVIRCFEGWIEKGDPKVEDEAFPKGIDISGFEHGYSVSGGPAATKFIDENKFRDEFSKNDTAEDAFTSNICMKIVDCDSPEAGADSSKFFVTDFDAELTGDLHAVPSVEESCYYAKFNKNRPEEFFSRGIKDKFDVKENYRRAKDGA